MNKISKELLKIARQISSLDEEGDGSGFQGLIDQENDEQNLLDLAEKQGKKYILHHKEGNLWRIQACKNIRYFVTKGDFGGLIQSQDNLSHDGDCWVSDDAKVEDRAIIYDNAHISGRARIMGNAKVYGIAKVYGNANVYQDAEIFGNAHVYDQASVFGNAHVYDQALVCDFASVFGYALVCNNTKVCKHATVTYNTEEQQEITE